MTLEFRCGDTVRPIHAGSLTELVERRGHAVPEQQPRTVGSLLIACSSVHTQCRRGDQYIEAS